MSVPVRSTILVAALLAVLVPGVASAQIPGWLQRSFSLEQIDKDNFRLTSEVEIEGEAGTPNAGQKFFADYMELNIATGEMTARGNVVFQTPTAKISADSVVFNTKTKLGTFHTASVAELMAVVRHESSPPDARTMLFHRTHG